MLRARTLGRGLTALACILLLLTAVLLRGGCSELPADPYATPPPSASSWSEVLAREPAVEVTAIITGHAIGDRAMVLDPDDENLSKLPDRYEPSVVVAYHVRHPREGDIVIDAGLSRTFTAGGGNYGALLRLLLAVVGATVDQRPGQDLASWLRARAITPRTVLLTHLHGDHTSGVADLSCDVAVVFGDGDDTFMQKALLGDHLDCHPLQRLVFDDARPMPPFDQALDLFGDGSVWALSTPGHTAGHVSYLVHGRRGPILITGDAAAYQAQIAHRIRPSPGVHDPRAAARSLDRIVRMRAAHPEVIVAAGHELAPELLAEP